MHKTQIIKKIISYCSILCLLGLCHLSLADAPHQIDKAASAKAPWKSGATVVRGNRHIIQKSVDPADYKAVSVYRVFLGVTNTGRYIVQEFYTTKDAKATNSYLLINKEDVTKEFCDVSDPDDPCESSIEGEYTTWYPNGQKEIQSNYTNGQLHGSYEQFYNNGQKMCEATYEQGDEIGHSSLWSYEGYQIL